MYNYSHKTVKLYKSKTREYKYIFCCFWVSKDEGLKEITKYTGKYYNVYTKEDMIKVFRDIFKFTLLLLFTYKPPKYWGYHRIFADLTLPNKDKTL